MIITAICPVTRQKYRVVTDEELAFVLYKGELSHYRLQAGQELPDGIFQEIYREILVRRAKQRAMHLLTAADHSEMELRRKLQRGEYTERAVEEAIAYVKSFHYLDDERYAKQYQASASGKKSRRQILMELQGKGISREIIANCSEWEDGDETALIRSLLEKKCREPDQADDREKRRLYAFLARKGFRSEEISRVFREYFPDFHQFS